MKPYIYAAALILAGAAPVASPAHAADACATPKKYIEYVRAGAFDRIGPLFAEDAVLYTPVGAILHGAKAIDQFYTTVVAGIPLAVEARTFVSGQNECFFEIWSRSTPNAQGRYMPDPAGELVRAAVDHFTVNDQGLVVQMAAFPAPNVSTISVGAPPK
ncbi:MAG: nuclear transport factor 2 family protein [Rhodospirillaceae bacterium]